MAVETKQVLYCVGAVVCIGLLFGTMPIQIANQSTTLPHVPQQYLGVEISGFSETEIFRNNHTEFTGLLVKDCYRVWDLGGLHWIMLMNNDTGGPFHYASWVMLGVRSMFWGIWMGTFWCSWVNATGYNFGTNLSYSHIGSFGDVQDKFTCIYEPSPEKSCTLFFVGNETLSSSPASSFLHHKATIVQGVGVSNTTSSINGIAFFIQLLTFQTPNINPWVNVLLWVAIGVPCALVIIELVRSFIPLLP